jgi:hypothetical protein
MQQFIKRLLLLLAFSFCSFSGFSQDILWEKSYGGQHAEYLFDAVPTPDYGFLLAGSSISNKNGNKSDTNKGDLDFWLWKMNEKGDLDWQKSFGGSGIDLLQSILLTPDAGFILAGTSTSSQALKGETSSDKKDPNLGDADIWIIKLDAKGGELWQKTLGGSGQEKIQSMTTTMDGGYILGGSSSSSPLTPKGGKDTGEKAMTNQVSKNEDSRGNLDYWVVKLDTKGNVQWQKTIGGAYVDELKSIVQTKDGGYLLGGYSNSPVSGDKTQTNLGIGDYWIVKLDATGTILWQKTLGGDQDDNLFALIPTQDGGSLAGGNSNSGATDAKSKGNGEGSDFWVLKLDPEGVITWQETYNYGKVDVLTSLLENPDGTYLIGGYSPLIPEGGIIGKLKGSKDKEGINDYIALKINNKGEKIWERTVKLSQNP